MTLRILILLIAAIGGCGSAWCEPATLRFGQIPSTAHAVSSLYLFVAQKQGFFARENIAIEAIQIPGGTGNMVAALDRGEVDVTQTATPYLIQAVLKGSPAAAIAGTTANPIYSLIAKPDIQSFAELKGRLIGLSLPIDTISISMRKLLVLKGLGDADYRVKELVGSPLRATCLKSGECDAVPLGQPEGRLSPARHLDRSGRIVPVRGDRGAPLSLRPPEQRRIGTVPGLAGKHGDRIRTPVSGVFVDQPDAAVDPQRPVR